MSETGGERYWLGFDLGGTKMLSTVFDSDYQILGRRRKKTNGHEGPEAGMVRIVQTIDRSLVEAGIERDQLAGIGIGCPGPVDYDQGILREAPNLGWKNVPVQKLLEKEYGCPVALANDVDAGVYGEYRFGAAQGARCVVGVFPGTGIGGGCVYEGKILRGKSCSCMEIGHIPMMPAGPISGTGHRGTLEKLASRLAISAATAQAAYRGDAPHLLESAGTNLSKIRSGTLVKAIADGDKVIERIVREAAELIGIGISGVVHLMAPDMIVLGGGLVEAMPELFVNEVKKSVKRHVLSSFADVFQVVAAELGDNATVKGAAAWAREQAAV